jgi:AraC family transcriptional regulator, regulatory protein of adaptative response / methylated-DNA-[protein]-cysteine methyltransferase
MDAQILSFEQQSQDYYRIEQALNYLNNHTGQQPTLKEVADSLNLSEYHFQRMFTRWVGISPKRFLQYLTRERAKALLAQSHSLLDVALEAGLSGPGRLHDLFVATEAVTPGEYKSRGQGLQVKYGFHPSPFGECLVACTPRGLSNLIFVQDGNRAAALKTLQLAWPLAELRESTSVTGGLVPRIFNLGQETSATPLSLHLQGTNFQIKVWEALLAIPPGSLVAYEDLAVYIGLPKAVRAVANAVGKNPVPVIIPCHRVIRKMGGFGGYRYGLARKQALLGWEMAGSQAGF